MSSKDALNLSNRIVLIIERVEWDLSNIKVQHILENVNQIFIGYEFLHYPNEDLESKSVVIGQGILNEGISHINFKRGNKKTISVHML